MSDEKRFPDCYRDADKPNQGWKGALASFGAVLAVLALVIWLIVS